MPSSHLILCRPLLLLPPFRPSIRVFSNESTLRYAEYIMRNARIDEAQTGIKIAGRNINNLIYAVWHHSFGRKWRRTRVSILSSILSFSSCLHTFPASGSFPRSQFFSSIGQSIGVSASAKVLPMNIQDWFPYDWFVWVPCSPRDSQDSSPTPQFKSIRFSELSFLYSPTLTSIHDYGKNHRFD